MVNKSKNILAKSDTAKLVNLLQVATDNEQPITLNMTLGVFNGIVEYRTAQALEAYKEEQARLAQVNDNGDLVSPKQAKSMFPNGISDATLWRYCRSGLLHKKNVGGKVFYSKAEISKLMED